MGGMHGFGRVVEPGSELPYHERWEPRVFALSTIVGIEGIGRGSGRAIREEMEPSFYLGASYYERWLWSTEQRLLRKGTIEPGELDARVERLRSGEPAPRGDVPGQRERVLAAIAERGGLATADVARFAAGDQVVVSRRRHPGHTRCPRYARGVRGVVRNVRGVDALPDIGPYAGPEEPVYSVAFVSDDVFGPGEGETWTILLDLYESYLDPA